MIYEKIIVKMQHTWVEVPLKTDIFDKKRTVWKAEFLQYIKYCRFNL